MKENNKFKKVKVIDIFRDKYTNRVYKLNDILEVDEKRFLEIKAYVEEIIEEVNSKETEEIENEKDNLEEVNPDKEETKQETQKENKNSKK